MLYENIAISILQNDIPSKEWDVRINGKQITCYIEVVDDAQISIETTVGTFSCKADVIGCRYTIDGNRIDHSGFSENETSICDKTMAGQKIQFSVPTVRPNSENKHSQVGEISVRCSYENNKGSPYMTPVTLIEETLTEKGDIKTNLISHSVKFGERTIREHSVQKGTRLQDICEFIFKYRSCTVLLLEGKMPSPFKTEIPEAFFQEAVYQEVILDLLSRAKRARTSEEIVRPFKKTKYPERVKSNGSIEIDLTVQPSTI